MILPPIVVAAAHQACSPPKSVIQCCNRFIAEDPHEFLHEAVLFSREVVRKWDSSSFSSGRWVISPPENATSKGFSGVSVHGIADYVDLKLWADIWAEDIHEISVVTRGLSGRAEILFCWAATEGEFSRELCVRTWVTGEQDAHTIALRDYPHWTGKVRGVWIRISPVTSRQEFAIESISALQLRPIPNLLASALRRSWKVTLEGGDYRDTRSAVMSIPNQPVGWTIDVKPGAVLRFSYALHRNNPSPVRFRVVAETQTQGGNQTTLFQETVNPKDPGANLEWQEAAVPLESFGGQTITFRFESEADGDLDLARGAPVWANPEVSAPLVRRSHKNLILISIDTLRADRLSVYGHVRPTSPNIDSWAQRHGVIFETAVAPSPWTIPSHISMFTGADALTHGHNVEKRVSTSLEMLAEILRELGYRTAAITGGGYLNASYGFHQGFDRYAAWKEVAKGNLEPRSGVNAALEWLDETDGTPFFLFLHTYGVHTPFHPRPELLSTIPDLAKGRDLPPQSIGTRLKPMKADTGFVTDMEWIWLDDPRNIREGKPLQPEKLHWGADFYDGAIMHVDSQLGRLLRHLEESGKLKQSVVILTSDHGENLGEKGLVGHTALYDPTLRVPLIIADPEGGRVGQRIVSQVRTIDITPTIMELLSIKHAVKADGVSLVSLMNGNSTDLKLDAWSYAALSNRGLSLRANDGSKIIFNNAVWGVIAGKAEFYNLVNDPGESLNLGIETTAARALIERARSRLASSERLGLHFRFRNNVQADEIICRIGAKWGSKATSRIKSWNVPATAVDWTSGSGMPLRVLVKHGEIFDIVVESPESLEVKVQIEMNGQPAFTRRIDLAHEPRMLSFRCEDGEWTTVANPEKSTPFDVLFVSGPTDGASQIENQSARDDELLEQLRVLGYVE